MNIEAQVERVLREIDQRVMYVRHHDAFDQVWFICTECVAANGPGEHEEVVAKGEKPKLECPWNSDA